MSARSGSVRTRMMATAGVTLALLPLRVALSLGSDEPPKTVNKLRVAAKPDGELEWNSQGKGFAEWNAGGWCLYAHRTKDYVLDVWTWEGPSMTKAHSLSLPAGDTVAWWPGHGGLLRPYEGKTVLSNAVLMQSPEGGEAQRWLLPRGWHLQHCQASRNGRYVALGARENFGHEPPDTPADFDWNRLRVQLYLLGPENAEPTLVTTIIGKNEGDNVRAVIPSDDGAYIAVAGWNNGLVMVDAKAGKELWKEQLPGEAELICTEFAPDNSVAYAGGTMSAVYTVDVKTGKALNQWSASPTGKYEYLHSEIECLAVSPDGRWVAAGTSQALVFVGSTATGKPVKVLKHGGRPVQLVKFSPDSRALASWAPGTIKIWNVSRWDKGTHASSQPAATSQPASAPAPPGP
jgi:WD40 repeat protein